MMLPLPPSPHPGLMALGGSVGQTKQCRPPATATGVTDWCMDRFNDLSIFILTGAKQNRLDPPMEA